MASEMKDKTSSIEEYWKADQIHQDDGSFEVKNDYDFPVAIIQCDVVMQRLIRSYGPLFSLDKHGNVACSELGRELLWCLDRPFASIEKTFSRHKFCPYFSLMAKGARQFGRTSSDLTPEAVDHFNWFAQDLRRGAGAIGVSDVVAAQDRLARKNAASVRRLIRSLFKQYAKLVVVRIDLGFSKKHRESLGQEDPDPMYFNRRVQALLRYIERKYPTFVAYILRFEYAPIKSIHCHVMLLFNGHEAREDETLAMHIGKYWESKITKKTCTYFNCNAKKHVYDRLRILGIGTVQYHQIEKRNNLERAAEYLAKADYYLKLQVQGIVKTFRRSPIRQVRGVRRGRPRQYSEVGQANNRRVQRDGKEN